jgi:hypothetical protein
MMAPISEEAPPAGSRRRQGARGSPGLAFRFLQYQRVDYDFSVVCQAPGPAGAAKLLIYMNCDALPDQKCRAFRSPATPSLFLRAPPERPMSAALSRGLNAIDDCALLRVLSAEALFEYQAVGPFRQENVDRNCQFETLVICLAPWQIKTIGLSRF